MNDLTQSKPFLLLLAAILSASALPRAAEATAADGMASDTPSAHYQAAYNLAELQQGGPKLSDELIANMRSQMSTAFSADPDISFLEAEYPGITDAMLDAVVPIVVRQTEDSMPVFFDRLARLYMTNLSEAEIQDMIGFVDTPTYDRLRTSIENNIDITKLLTEDPEADVTAEELNDVVTDSAVKSVGNMSKKDRMTLVIMSAHPSFKKFSKLKGQRQKLEADWTNESTPEEDAEMEAATTTAIEKFTGLDQGDF